MSDFLRRWSARKREALQVPAEQALADAVLAPSPDDAVPAEAINGDALTGQKAGSAQDIGATAGSGETLVAQTNPGLPDSLPDKETLRALFRTQQPDGLDDYNQDFSRPELLTKALTAGLRHWLATPAEPEAQRQQEPLLATVQAGQSTQTERTEEQAMVTKVPVSTSPETLSKDHQLDRDILPQEVGQNVALAAVRVDPLRS